MRSLVALMVVVGCGDNVRFAIDAGTIKPDMGVRDALLDGVAEDSDSAGADTPDAPPAPVLITTYSAGVQVPLAFVAAQDGTTSWHTLHSTDGVYSFEAPSGRYGIAYVCGTSAAGNLYFDYATRDEDAARVERCGNAPVPSGALTTAITGLQPGSAVQVTAAELADWGDTTVPMVTLAPVRAGSHDVAVSYWPDSYQISRIGIRRGVAVVAGTTTNMSVNAIANTVPVTSLPISVLGQEFNETIAAADAELITTTGTRARITALPLPPLPGAVGQYYGLPVSELEPGDMHVIRVRVFNIYKSREIRQYVHVPSAATVTLPPAFVAGVSVAAPSPYVRLGVVFVPFADNVYQLDARQLQPARHVSAMWSSGWVAGTSQVTWDQPDFSALEDWHAEWALVAGQTTSWSVAAAHDPQLDVGDPAWDGVAVTRSTRYGSLTP